MSLRLSKSVVVPEETAQVARAAFPRGSLLLSLRDELGPIFDDQRFAALFPKLGQPAEAPWRLALVTLLQFMEGLSDCAAADTVRGRIDWKYVLALPLRDPGFDSSVLCEFRSRLITGGAERVLFDTVLDLARLRGLVRARGRQRTDATHVLAAVRGLNRLACVTEAMRFTLEALAYAAPDWLKANAQPGWVERYERPSLGTERPPRSEVKRTTLAQVIGEDGHRLLAAVWTPDAPGWLRNIPAVEILRRIWVQQFYLLDGTIRWRSSDDTPPAGLFLNSPHDLDAHYAKTDTISWVGYKAHLTETCDADYPRIITDVQTSPAPVADHRMVVPVHEALAERHLLPAQHLVDTGYTDAGLLIDARQRFEIDLIGPVRRDVRWRAQAGGRFAIAAFQIDWAAERVTCPRGVASSSWTPALDSRGTPGIKVKFSRRDCQPCPHRVACAGPKATRRLMSLRPQARHEALAQARERQDTAAFARLYAQRAGIEATLSLAVRSLGLRRARYAGLAKVRLQHLATAAALNLTRMVHWIADKPIATTRRSHFGRLLTPLRAA